MTVEKGSPLQRYRDKWRETPRGSDTDGRIFSTDLLKMPPERLAMMWEEMAARRYNGEIGWLGPLYFDTFRGKKIVELGSGLGFDGLRFAGHGAHWTFADIVPDNLEVIRRIASLKGLNAHVRFHLIDDALSFDELPCDFDAVWAFGSIHHVPFDIARQEALNILGHLKPDGRWMELVYPRERWLREGAPPFEEWGKLTDGERTPWAEWHDVHKVRRRLHPEAFNVILDFEFCSHNYRWIDLLRIERQRLEDRRTNAPSLSIDLKAEPLDRESGTCRRPFWTRDWSFRCPRGLFAVAARLDLEAAMERLGASSDVAIDLEIHVSDGAVGVGLEDGRGSYLSACETVIEGSRDTKLVTLRADRGIVPATLVFRNIRADRRSVFRVASAVLRLAR